MENKSVTNFILVKGILELMHNYTLLGRKPYKDVIVVK